MACAQLLTATLHFNNFLDNLYAYATFRSSIELICSTMVSGDPKSARKWYIHQACGGGTWD